MLMVHCLMFSPIVCGGCVWSLFCYALLSVLLSFEIILAVCFTLNVFLVSCDCL